MNISSSNDSVHQSIRSFQYSSEGSRFSSSLIQKFSYNPNGAPYPVNDLKILLLLSLFYQIKFQLLILGCCSCICPLKQLNTICSSSQECSLRGPFLSLRKDCIDYFKIYIMKNIVLIQNIYIQLKVIHIIKLLNYYFELKFPNYLTFTTITISNKLGQPSIDESFEVRDNNIFVSRITHLFQEKSIFRDTIIKEYEKINFEDCFNYVYFCVDGCFYVIRELVQVAILDGYIKNILLHDKESLQQIYKVKILLFYLNLFVLIILKNVKKCLQGSFILCIMFINNGQSKKVDMKKKERKSSSQINTSRLRIYLSIGIKCFS
ncbi:unnamed protein product [Paramecium sonneborni]|uniref:Uncharacterized protein n=1 Tax=Paramecium sonneborni TaxID=65129 RepID=A0A8S1RCE3_9CILI|nr:unnamed protein product [Paramecium sonneborni]